MCEIARNDQQVFVIVMREKTDWLIHYSAFPGAKAM